MGDPWVAVASACVVAGQAAAGVVVVTGRFASWGGRFDLGTPHFDLDRAKRQCLKACPIPNFKAKIPK